MRHPGCPFPAIRDAAPLNAMLGVGGSLRPPVPIVPDMWALPETGRQEKIWRRVTRTGNAQTADVRGPEPRPAVELPILPHNAPFSASVRQDDWWLGPVIARMRRAPRIAGTWRVYGE